MEAHRVLHEQSIESRIAGYHEAIGQAIAGHVEQEQATVPETIQRFGEAAGQSQQTYLEFLFRSGKRVRGMLVMAGYEMFGGSDTAMAAQAGLAIEMIHASLLIKDDMQDNSDLRRGLPAVHTLISRESAAIVADQGIEQAKRIFGGLEGVPAERKVIIGNLVAETLIITGRGQTADNELKASNSPSLENIYAMMEAKTARYTILNPLQVGMILAGATQPQAEALEDFAINAGIAYQIRNDLKVINQHDRDDIVGDKPTVLMHYALGHVSADDQQLLRDALGQPEIGDEQFTGCQQVLVRCGAVAHANEEIERFDIAAKQSLPANWPKDRTEFLTQIIDYIAGVQK